jgi:hypothetical protein
MTESNHWVVEKILRGGKHGPYAVARDQLLGSVTFSLLPEVWQEDRFPQPGTQVVLENFQKKRAGWRAVRARFFRPSDIVNSNKQSA